MASLTGHVASVCHGRTGEIVGLIIEGGREVRFPGGRGHLVSLIVGVGCGVFIEGVLRSDDSSRGYFEATVVTNLDTNRSINFLAPHRRDDLGMLLERHPHSEASLVSADFALNMDVASAISSAYDRLHRIQAILAYLHILKRQIPGIGQFLSEAKHNYEQSLSLFDLHDFSGAFELAAASIGLSRVVQIVISRTLRSDSSLPSLVPPPPESMSVESGAVEDQLKAVRVLLARIQEIVRESTIPLEARAQIRRIACWSNALYAQAQQKFNDTALSDAAELSEAALVGARSAKHLCRMWHSEWAIPRDGELTQYMHP